MGCHADESDSSLGKIAATLTLEAAPDEAPSGVVWASWLRAIVSACSQKPPLAR
jgi:hypothetical protein